MSECLWCHRDRELKTHSDQGLKFDQFVAAAPEGQCLWIPYGKLCAECFDDVRDQWERTGELTQPLSAFGGDGG